MGGTCTVDAECASLDCSTDGVTTATGHCNQMLGTSCTAPQNGHNVTATCNDCDLLFGDPSGICFRPRCDPDDASHCPAFGGRTYQCLDSVDGSHHCDETCSSSSYRCYDDADFCHDGACSG